MTDIVARLRDAWGDCHCGTAPLLEAADEIARLREHIAALQLVATTHEPEVERLRAALKQLASMAESGARSYDDNELRDLLIEIDNQARRALEPKP